MSPCQVVPWNTINFDKTAYYFIDCGVLKMDLTGDCYTLRVGEVSQNKKII